MPDLSTHVLNGAGGGPSPGVDVEVRDRRGECVGRGRTDQHGRLEQLAVGLPCGVYTVTWNLDGFVARLSATVDLVEERRYHLPVLASGHSAVVYLGV